MTSVFFPTWLDVDLVINFNGRSFSISLLGGTEYWVFRLQSFSDANSVSAAVYLTTLIPWQVVNTFCHRLSQSG